MVLILWNTLELVQLVLLQFEHEKLEVNIELLSILRLKTGDGVELSDSITLV
jgi:hypothetical protein